MMDLDLISTALSLAIVVIAVVYLWYPHHDPRLPPCPVTPWPIVGNLVHLERNPRQQLLRWRKQCGDLYSLYLGSNLVIVLNGYERIKEALVQNGTACCDRPFMFYDVASGYTGKGVVFASGATWKEQREVMINILKHIGMGKNVMAEKITELVEYYMEALAGLKGKPTDIHTMTSVAVANVSCFIAIGHRFNIDDEDFQKCVRFMRANARDAGTTALPNYFHFLSYFPGDLFKAAKIKQRAHYIMDEFVEKFIQQKGFDEFDENNTDNYIAAYVKERNRKMKAGLPTTMDDVNLKRCIYDLFGAGMEPISATLMWCVLYLLHNPDMEEKLHLEIEREVGTQRLPNMHDKTKLTFLNAYILEITRITDVVPYSVPYKTSAQVTLGGYNIPKGTQLIANLDSVLWEKEIWGEDVMSFRPDRFIDDDGKLKHFEELIPFSIGKRICPGEGLTQVELFLFFAAMVQRFQFLPVDPANLPPLESVFGIDTPPVPYQVRVVDRRE